MLSLSIERGCGKRQAGGAYAECLTGPNGHPIEEFLIDPPYPVDPEQLGLTPVGVKLVEVVGQVNPDGSPVYWIWDWVGSQHYPNPVDFVEEARLYGASRRLPTNLNWSLVTRLTRLVLVHTRAGINPGAGLDRLREREVTWPEYARRECTQVEGQRHCRRPRKEHPEGGLACAKYLWQTVRKGEPIDQPTDSTPQRPEPPRVRRKLGSTEYTAIPEVDPPLEPSDHYLGIFLRLPVHRIAVIRDDAGGKHEQALEKLEQANLPVDLLEE